MLREGAMPPPTQQRGMGSAVSSPIGVWGGAPEALQFVQLLCSKAIQNQFDHFHEK